MSILHVQPAPLLPPPPAPHPLRAPSPFNAAPGAVPFNDFLRATNEIDRATPHRPAPDRTDSYEPSPAACTCPDPWRRENRYGAAKLGDVPLVTDPAPTPRERTNVHDVHRVMSPIGATIDLTV